MQEAELQRQHLTSVLMQAPTPIAVLRGRDYVFNLVNPLTAQIWGRPSDALINRPLFEALPEIRDRGFKELLDGVYDSGVPYTGRETPLSIDRRGDGTLDTLYVNFVYTPLRNIRAEVEGILVIAFDVTEEVLARERVQAHA